MCASLYPSLCGEWKLKRALQDMEAPEQTLAFFFSGNLRLIFFSDKDKSNTSFGTVKDLLLFVCTHIINKTCFYKTKKTNMMCFLPSRLEQERFTKMNRS